MGSSTTLPTEIQMCLLTNPLFRVRCIKDLIGFASEEASKNDNLLKELSLLIYLNKPVTVEITKAMNNSDKLNLKLKFGFRGNGRSKFIMQHFLCTLTTLFGYIKNEENISPDFIMNQYLEYLASDTALDVNPERFLIDSDYKEILKQTRYALNSLNLSANLSKYIRMSEHELSVRYITGIDGVLNAFYTIWKYHIVAKIYQIAGQIKSCCECTTNIHPEDDSNIINLEVLNIPIKDLGKAIKEVISSISLDQSGLIDGILSDMIVNIKSDCLYVDVSSSSDIRYADKAAEDIDMSPLFWFGLIPSKEDAQNSASINVNLYKKLSKYRIVLPQTGSKTEELINRIRNSDYAIVFDVPDRWSNPSSKTILKGLCDSVVNAMTHETEWSGKSKRKSDTYSILNEEEYTDPAMVDYMNKYLIKTYREIMGINNELSDSDVVDAEELDNINGTCNDLMINGAFDALSVFTLGSRLERDISNSTSTSIFKELPNETVGDDKLLLRDLFQREEIKVPDSNEAEVTQPLGDLVNGFESWYVENSSKNKPVNMFAVQAVDFNNMTDEYDEKIVEDVVNSTTISNQNDESISWAIYQALKYKTFFNKYEEIIHKYVDTNKNEIYEDILNLRDYEEVGCSILNPMMRIQTKFFSKVCSKINSLLSDTSDYFISQSSITDLILGDINTDIYNSVFTKDLKSLIDGSLDKSLYTDLKIKSEDVDFIGDLNTERSVRNITTRLTELTNIVGITLRDCLRLQLSKRTDIANCLKMNNPLRTLFPESELFDSETQHDPLANVQEFNSYIKQVLSSFDLQE